MEDDAHMKEQKMDPDGSDEGLLESIRRTRGNLYMGALCISPDGSRSSSEMLLAPDTGAVL